MEENLPVSGDRIGCRPFSLEEMQNYHSLFLNPQQVSDSFSFGDQFDQRFLFLDDNKDESLNPFAGNSNGQNGFNGLVQKNEPLWERIKWTDEMVKVLITAISYVGHDGLYGAPIKGKWRIISNAMVERGYTVSPQQCEDKFNDLNRKYKRVKDLLGSNSCDVVENPSLIELMNIPKKSKEEVKKILTCKQLFYHEMCSFHGKDRKYLPHDELLQKSVRSGLKGKKVKYRSGDNILGMSIKRQKKHEEDSNEASGSFLPEGQQEVMMSRLLQLEEKKLQIQKNMFELEKKKFEWLKLSQQQDRELHKMKLENELMRLENERLEFELKRRDISDNRS
ncbi:hypothetical protein BUALT_Bualt19G0090600 [Buddleja alternifolia]|uniref:Myb-like domain-containing protein n=1 Tax=Buddleja alternifolia TaxID=168488 RepID=A0AAV6W0J9_9LAMI|nr:hypothetical protein BUALT_Bualt19G0090600 [Buddleja alternifolia]